MERRPGGGFPEELDAMLAGNLGQRRRMRFMPGSFQYQETKAPPLKDAYDEFLARIVCFVFSISPEPFVGQVNRATAETSHSRAIDEGLAPLMRFVRNFLNRIIACEFASPDLEFTWQDAREQDPAQAAQIDVAYVGAGILTVDEVRANMGLAPMANVVKPTLIPTSPPTNKYNPNHLGPGPGGGQFTSAGQDGTSSDLPAGSGEPRRSELTPPSRAGELGTQVAQISTFIKPLIDVTGETDELAPAAMADTAATASKPVPAESPAPTSASAPQVPMEPIAAISEISRIIDKANQTTGNDGDVVSGRNIAEEAAKQFVGNDSEEIYDRQSGESIGEVSADGLRVARFNNANKSDPYINLENKSTGGNLHIRWLK